MRTFKIETEKAVLLNELKRVFSVFDFQGKISPNGDDGFVLKMKCDAEHLNNFQKAWIFQDIEKAFKLAHPWQRLKRVNGLGIEFEIDCEENNYLVYENHFDNYSEFSLYQFGY